MSVGFLVDSWLPLTRTRSGLCLSIKSIHRCRKTIKKQFKSHDGMVHVVSESIRIGDPGWLEVFAFNKVISVCEITMPITIWLTFIVFRSRDLRRAKRVQFLDRSNRCCVTEVR